MDENLDLIESYKTDLQKNQSKIIKKNITFLKIKEFVWKNKWRIMSYIIIGFLLMFPDKAGIIIGKWIYKLLFNIINQF
jgi:hypothetical protein